MNILSQFAIASIRAGMDPNQWIRIVKTELLSDSSAYQLQCDITDWMDSLNPEDSVHVDWHIRASCWLDYFDN